MALAFTWDAVPLYLTIVFSAGLAIVLLYLDFQKRANRAFALLLLVRAAALTVLMLRNASTTTAEFEFFQRLFPYFQLAHVPAFLYFLFVYPRPRTWFGRSKWGGWALLGGALGLEVIYALDHSLYWTYAPGETTLAVLRAGRGFIYTSFGPLSALAQFTVPISCLVAAFLARDYLRERPGSARFSLVLIVAGLLLSGLYYGTQALVALSEPITAAEQFPWLPWGWAFAAGPALALPLAAAALAMVWAGSRRTTDRADDREANRLLLVAPIPVAWALVASLLADDIYGDEFSVFSIGVWRLLMPVLVTYALMRYRLFDLDLKARFTIHYGGIAAAFGVVMFLASELAEGLVAKEFLPDVFGDWAGIIAAAMLTLAIRPLERATGRFAQRLFPSAKPIHELNEKQRKAVYKDQFAMALQDGRLTSSERKMLADLQARLGLNLGAASPDPAPR